MFEVICSNVGIVYTGRDEEVARERYTTYVGLSKEQYGRAAGEQVTLMCDGEIIAEHESTLPKETDQ